MQNYTQLKTALQNISASLEIIRKTPELATMGRQYNTFFCSLADDVHGAQQSIDEVLEKLADRFEYAEVSDDDARIMHADNKAKEARILGEGAI